MPDLSIAKLSKDMIGKNVEGWVIESYVNCGNSGAVFRAKNSTGQIAAIKIISNEIIQRHGKEEQVKRIEREKLIIGHSHPNLIQIFDGGVTTIENQEYLFIAMEYLDQNNLKDINSQISVSMVPNIIQQLASACCYLEGINIAHRDIKLENIVIDPNFQTIKLLDLGVLRPILSESEYPRNTDFIATLRASPPELMERKEGNSLEDWRAITFYQIGVVIYELLAKSPIFEKQSTPKPALILAVKSAYPSFDEILHENDILSKSLMQLCKKCLRKDPIQRTSILTWKTFENILNSDNTKDLAAKASFLRATYKHENGARQIEFKAAQQTKAICEELKDTIRGLCQNNPSNCLYPVIISHNIKSSNSFTLTITLAEIHTPMVLELKINLDLNTLSVFNVTNNKKVFLYDDNIGSDDLSNEIINSLLLHYIENMSPEEELS